MRIGGRLSPDVRSVTDSYFFIADMEVDRFRCFSCHRDVVIAGEAHHVGKLSASGGVGKVAILWALKRNTALDANPRASAGDRADAKDEDVIRPARITHNVMALEMLPQNPVIDTRAANPAFKQRVWDSLSADASGR